MRELSLHILDIVQNSVKAQAKLVMIDIIINNGYLNLKIVDDGKGMSEDFLARVLDPFTTTRTTRNVGLGLPLLKQSAEMANGKFYIKSELNKGTEVFASYELDNIDRVPLGDIVSTIITLISPSIDFVWIYQIDDKKFVFDTREVTKELDGISIDSPEILIFLQEYLKENIESINGGNIIL
ncbi:MAG: ATP-binding protein [Clostridia bacterium]